MAGHDWYETLDRDTVYEGWSTVHRDTVRMPDGDETMREVVEHLDAVAVVPVLDDGSAVLLRQYRHPVGRYLLEIPAGIRDVPDEDVTETAQRELAEEIGYRAGNLLHLIRFENSAGWSTEHTDVYLGRDLTSVPVPAGFRHEHEEADMEIVRMPLQDAAAEARAGRVTDAKTVIGLLLAADRLDL